MFAVSRTVLALATAAFLLTGCATTGSAGCTEGAAKDAEFKPAGEISSSQGGASWDATRVVGPKINVSKRCDGSWAGNISDGVIDVSVYPTRVAGSSLNLNWSREGDKTVIAGLVHGQMVRFEVDDKMLVIHTARNQIQVPRAGANRYGDITVTGEAAAENPPEPQLALALVGAFF